MLLPITAAEAVDVGSDKILLVGEGPFVKLFSLARSSLLSTVPVLETQAIHGISCFTLLSSPTEFDLFFVLWGGRSLLFMRLQFQRNFDGLCLRDTTLYREIRLDDWVLDAKFLPDDEKSASKVVFLDAHNNLFSLECPQSSDDNAQVEPLLLARGPPSALYCGNIQFGNDGDVLVASGTVFGGVHLWSTKPVNKIARPGRLIAMYTGHEGSVYGICLSRLRTQKASQWVIMTCSDDRTIKMWNVRNELDDNCSTSSLHDLETGFAKIRLGNSFEAPIASNTGHLSRIWRIAAASTIEHGSILITFGEDATAQLWQLQIDAEANNLTLNKCRTINLHTGKNIWTGLMIEGYTNNQTRVVTGGADGRLTVSGLDVLHRQTVWSSDASDVDGLMAVEMSGSYCWLDCSRLLAVDVTGSLSLGTMKSGHQKSIVQWFPVTKLTELSRHVLLCYVGPNHVLIAGSAGHVYLFSAKDMKVQLLLKMHHKISFLFGVYSGEAQDCCINIVFVCLRVSKLYTGVVHTNINSSDIAEVALKDIDLPAGFILTAAQSLGSNVLTLGSRNGGVAICQVNQEFAVQRLDLLPRIHGYETVTSIQHLGNHEWILTTGRDGHFRIHKIEYHSKSIDSICVHSGKLPFGPDIEGAKLIEGELYIWGFKGSEFILWHHKFQQELTTLECSGRHRSWSFCHGPISALAWTRASKLCIGFLRPNSILLQQGSHGREIKALAIRQNNDTLGRIFATGAEDTCVHLSRYNNDNSPKQYQTLQVIPTHNTGLQKLAWSSDGSLLFSAAGKEEFLVWQVQSVPVLQLGTTLLARCPPVTPSQILRIMDFDFIKRGQVYTILMVYSDSSIRSWHFDPIGRGEKGSFFELRTEAIYSTCCITQCKILGGKYLLTASTDGYLVLWRLDDLSQISKQRVHQSSIKCLEVREWHEAIQMVVTGGDDGALAFGLLDLCASHWLKRLVVPKAHASAINGLIFLGTRSQFEVVSVSNDQRVKKWDVAVVREGVVGSFDIVVKRSGNHASSVADAGCVQAFVQDDMYNIVVAGVGLEFWKEEEKSPHQEQSHINVSI